MSQIIDVQNLTDYKLEIKIVQIAEEHYILFIRKSEESKDST